MERITFSRLAICAYLAAVAIAVDIFRYNGCYKKSDLESHLTLQSEYGYQSRGYCQDHCGSAAIAALINSDTCYCGDSAKVLSTLVASDESECTAKCNGIDTEICGGYDYFSVLVNLKNIRDALPSSSKSSAVSGSSSSAGATSQSSSTSVESSSSSSSPSSLSSTSITSTTDSRAEETEESSSSGTPASKSSEIASSVSSTSSSTATTSPNSSSSSSSSSPSAPTPSATSRTPSSTAVQYSTAVTTIISSFSINNLEYSTVITTVFSTTPTPSSSNTEASATSTTTSVSKSSHKLSGGSIAGIIIGILLAIGLIAGLVYFLLWNRIHDDDSTVTDLEEKRFHQPYSVGERDPLPLHQSNPTSSATSRFQLRSGSENSMAAQGHGFFAEHAPMANYQEPGSGRPRLSNSSLPDVTENRPLRITNPDSD
ncbi:Wsc2p Ecym_3600 [Eremothecium cymbalariae DBVPG|uniref:WSC domain-containing protein n=1 Tax=Eremothecium cymbalariae (strain CBS 270.75 / DBVPG 7215 / KCTC 17166 / NRRL Y-17582) TaxID=931890 RepID=G8JQT1_ERECY|nr:Hypothetical protein Ecym_3600 [Eremothecium cymbalariae DBVPG\